MVTLVLGVAGAAIGGSIGGAILGVSAATIGGFIGSSIGSVVDSWIISSLAPTQRIEGARLDTLRIHLLDGGRRRPAPLWPHADGRQHHLGHGFPRGDQDHHAGRRQGRRGRQGQDDRVSVLCLLRSRALRRADHRHRPYLGRRQADGPFPGHLALVSRRRDADRRSPHRGEDGSFEHARLSRHGLCRLRGTAALQLWQPPATAFLRGVPAARRSRQPPKD